jgi:hypothetical protein
MRSTQRLRCERLDRQPPRSFAARRAPIWEEIAAAEAKEKAESKQPDVIFLPEGSPRLA